MLSDQLRNLANKARQGADAQMGSGMAKVDQMTNQAMQPQPGGGMPTKSSAQQIAGARTAAQQQVNLQTQQQLGGQLQQIGQQAADQSRMLDAKRLAEKQMLNDSQIAELQRKGVLRQNSKELNAAKQLQQNEIESQKRMLGSKLEFDDKVSFMTRKQREDLASLGNYVKQQVYDSRLAFENDELGRRFSNSRQLADYAVASFKSEIQLRDQMREMEQAATKNLMVLEHAHKLITQKMEMEFQRAEKTKDYAMLRKLQEYKRSIEEKAAREKAKSAAISNFIVGAATIAGSFYGPGGAAAASGTAKLATGYAEGQDWY